MVLLPVPLLITTYDVGSLQCEWCTQLPWEMPSLSSAAKVNLELKNFKLGGFEDLKKNYTV